LQDEEKSQLADQQCLTLPFSQGTVVCQMVISLAESGYQIHLRWSQEKQRQVEFGVPQAVLEVLRKGQGLSLIVGTRGSGKSTLTAQLVEELISREMPSIAYFSDFRNEKITGATEYQADLLLKNLSVSYGYDLIIVDSLKPMVWRQAVQLSEFGVRVLLTLPFVDIETSLRRLAEKIEADVEVGHKRVVGTLQIAISLKLLPGIEDKVQPAFELLFATSEVRDSLLAKNWRETENLIRISGETTGMRTMNQCLMNLMLKRKIDLKSGFATSPRPDELDQMLDKVGF
jgi:twitching motility protein PilT